LKQSLAQRHSQLCLTQPILPQKSEAWTIRQEDISKITA